MDPVAAPPPRRQRTLIAVLLVAFLVASGVAAYALIRLREVERERAAVSPAPSEPTVDAEDGDPLERLLGELEDLLGGAGTGAAPGAFECLAPDELLSGLLGPRAEARSPAATVRQVARQVERIRGLGFDEPLDAEFLRPEEVARRVRSEVAREYPARVAKTDERLLEALGAIPPGTDLRALLQEALGAQVAGFYDPRTGELVVRAGGGRVGTLERITLAHELEHALADQALGIPIPENPDPEREDADLAALALVEGDATLTMQRFALSLSLEEQFELFDPSALLEAQAGIEGMPYLLQRELLFPYEQGMVFVCDLYARGGWQAVNQAYDAPPRTTAEVLFPERYPAESPERLDDPARLGAPWRASEPRPLGAATLLWLLEAPGADPSRGVEAALDAVSGWAGGEIHLWTRGSETAVGVAVADDGNRLCGAIERWYRAAFPVARDAGADAGERFALDGGSQDAVLRCTAGEVRLGVAPDVAIARLLAR